MTPWLPRTCVWELTLACDAACVHCGSMAGRARQNELDTREALGFVRDLGRLGCESVTLSGGEPLLRRDWPELAEAIRDAGMRLELITNGLSVAAEAQAIAERGFWAVTFSVDGPAAVHDALRGVPGGLERLLRGAQELRERGVRVGAATQVNRVNLPWLGSILDLLVTHGFQGWQLQLTMPAGRARERTLCLEPEELPGLEERIVALQAEAPWFVQAADNIGYLSRREPRLRTGRGGPERCWMGCGAGLTVVGLASDGTVRGCLSLPPTADEGNIRERSLSDIWHDPNAFAYNRQFSVNDLGGTCRDCTFGQICRGGCQSLSLFATGAFHHNPYCSARFCYPGEVAG
jgi:radical SAM protein with 4Fe4S-binding SPASM domain